MTDLRVCRRDAEPLVFTTEFPGAEYLCVVCEGTEDLFGDRAPATSELLLRLTELTETYRRGYAERRGVEYVELAKVGDDGAEAPTCAGCGAAPPEGVLLDGGKPPGWFSRTREGVTTYACSRGCIPSGEAVLPW